MYYFASDMHLGMDVAAGDSASRERLLVRWLDEISADARAVFLMGDVFDFWFEYKRVVPRGFVRFLSKLAELTDKGVKVHFFPGNHDMWALDYLSVECGVEIHSRPEIVELDGKRVFLAHGDNMKVGNAMVRLMNALFRNRVVQWLFRRSVHPDVAMRFGGWWSRSSRKSQSGPPVFHGEASSLVRYAREKLREEHVDFFVFGHIHVAEDYDLGGGSRAIFLGDWMNNPSYAIMDGGEMKLMKYGNK